MSADQHASAGWLQVLPLLVIGVMAFMLWRPALDPPPTAEQEKKIAALTPEDVRTAFKKHIDPKKLVIIRAGDFKK